MIDLDEETRKGARPQVIVILVAITIIAIVALYVVSLSFFRTQQIGEAEARLALYQRSLNETLERFQHLPFVLARNQDVIAGAEGRDLAGLNRRLAEFTDSARLEAIYLMDPSGLVLSASNFDATPTFLGQNYSFRPYFQRSLAGERGEYFGVGATTGRPGFFVSEPVYGGGGQVSGVITIKLDMSELQAAWQNGGERVFVTNGDGVVVLASNADWLYRAITRLSRTQRDKIAEERQFGRQPLEALDWRLANDTQVYLGGNRFIYASAPAQRLDWRIHYLLDESRVIEQALLATAIFGSALIALILFATYMRSQRIQAALRAAQADRAELIRANRVLEEAQRELEQASKLAALGQLSASVVHELGQPLSALKNYLSAAELAGEIKPGRMIGKVAGVIDRMENITRQLRFFARRGEPSHEPVDLQVVLSGALELLQHETAQEGIKVIVDTPERPVIVPGERFRLEQVVVNLVKNSLAALSGQAAGSLTIGLTERSGQAVLTVADSGPGLGGNGLQTLVEPFFTSRASGDGMGLGLSIAAEIVSEHGGTMTAQDGTDGGAVFTVLLPVAKPAEAAA